jgi:hypothetical protein
VRGGVRRLSGGSAMDRCMRFQQSGWARDTKLQRVVVRCDGNWLREEREDRQQAKIKNYRDKRE